MRKHYDAHGDSEWACGGDDDCSAVQDAPSCEDGYVHKWTSEGTGGCDSNPGCWSLGGTTLKFENRCVICGCACIETLYGSQRNPGECDRRIFKPNKHRVDSDEARTECTRQRRNAHARFRRRRARENELGK